MRNIIYMILIIIFTTITKLHSIEVPLNLIIKELYSENSSSKASKDLDYLVVNYTGWIFNSQSDSEDYCAAKGKIFDSNTLDKFNHKKPFRFTLGKGVVIKGWDLGLKNMKINDVRCLVIPSNLAYGSRKIGDIIEANSTLIFEVKLIDISNYANETE